MAHQMAHKDALWPGAMIRLRPQWRKVKWAGIRTIVNIVVIHISPSHNSSKVTSVGLGLQYLHYNFIFNICQEKG